jgi:hypothetical protein
MKLITNFVSESPAGAQVFGVTFQDNGTIGTKDFFVKPSGNKNEYVGLSTYTFEDGTITAAFRGWPEKGREIGTYMVQTGTGRYAGGKGRRWIRGASGWKKRHQGSRYLGHHPERYDSTPELILLRTSAPGRSSRLLQHQVLLG